MGGNGIILGFTLLFSPLPSLPNFCLPLPPAPSLRRRRDRVLPRGHPTGIFVLQTRSDSSSIGRTLRAAGRVPSAII